MKSIKYYPATEKEWDIEYQYDKNILSKGIVLYNGTENGYIDFKYDSNGNTVERTENFSSAGQKDLIVEQFKLSYDDKIIPVKNLATYPFDIIQNNNPTRFYHEMIWSSSFPANYSITYEYDSVGLPLKEFRYSRVFEYEYIDKK